MSVYIYPEEERLDGKSIRRLPSIRPLSISRSKAERFSLLYHPKYVQLKTAEGKPGSAATLQIMNL